MAHGLAAGSLPTVLLGPLAPFHLENLEQARWVTSQHFFLLDCSEAVRRERLEARPPWRERQIEEQTRWGVWLRENMPEGVDTGRVGIDEAVRSIAGWVRSVISMPVRWSDDATLAAARPAAALGRIEAWVHDYLNGAGRNVPMVRGLRHRQRWWIGPVEELVRMSGPNRACPTPELLTIGSPGWRASSGACGAVGTCLR